MKECNFENLIDNYLLNKLSEEKKETFENHYFNCHSCFEKVEERNSLISVIKSKGDIIFQDRGETQRTRNSFFEKLFSSLSPKQWTMAAISACVLLIVVIGITPVLNLKSPTPQFVMDNQTVRGDSLALISPVKNVQTIPSEFSWDNLGEGVEYKIYIYKDNLLWSSTTSTASISLPEDIKVLLKDGGIYSWEVKAFSQEGSLIAASNKVQFQIDSHK
ncbi:MAG: hypothetical protein MUP98_16240 [Candidatus Aminicenantes bacterium]|nr:hypothetical protein [Candidatus Aminicenantes bacterium]